MKNNKRYFIESVDNISFEIYDSEKEEPICMTEDEQIATMIVDNLNPRKLDIVVRRVLMLDGTETFGIGNNLYNLYKELSIQLSNIQNNIRHCFDVECNCHPERKIKDLLENEKILRNFLMENDLLEDIYNLIKDHENTILLDVIGLNY